MYQRQMQCYFCKIKGVGRTLKTNALKLVKARYKDVTHDDTFCILCYHRIQTIVRKFIEGMRLARKPDPPISIDTKMSIGDISSSSSSTSSFSITDSLDRVLIEAPRNSKKRRTGESENARQLADQTTNSSSLSTTQTPPSTESNDWSMAITPIRSNNIRVTPEIGDIRIVRPILPSDADDAVWISDEGPSSLANVQPLIRRRRTPIVFMDERTVPIYNRRHYGG